MSRPAEAALGRGTDHPAHRGVSPRRVLLHVSGLDGPPVGGGCCGVSPDDLAVDELDSWPGLLVLHVDPDVGTILVRVADDTTSATPSKPSPTAACPPRSPTRRPRQLRLRGHQASVREA